MRIRAKIGVATAIVALLASAGFGATTAQASTTCTWGGTPLDPTGWFTIKPGATNTPITEPSKLYATGVLAGEPGCSGKMGFVGHINPGSMCAHSTFQGRVTGLPGVARFAGAGNVAPPSLLYDKDGNVVGTEVPQLVTGETGGASDYNDCSTPEGYSGGDFSSVVVLFD
jgi:hypothetical protein